MLRRTPLHISIPIKIVLEKREKSETVQRKCMFLAVSIYSMTSGVLIVLWKLWKENDNPGNSCHRKQQKRVNLWLLGNQQIQKANDGTFFLFCFVLSDDELRRVPMILTNQLSKAELVTMGSGH